MKFRFFKLHSTRRRSASCPNLEQAGLSQETDSVTDNVLKNESSSESENESANKFERLRAQKSIRRLRQKEREKMENVEKNLLSMDDYLGKLSELKTWLREEKHKDPDVMQSPKLKAHFKAFVRLWNKRKLPPQYYRTCSVDLEAADRTFDLDTEVMEGSATPRYPLLDGPVTPAAGVMSPIFPAHIVNLSPGDTLDDRDNESRELRKSVAVDSPFSTFGKTPEKEALMSPAELAKEIQASMVARQESCSNDLSAKQDFQHSLSSKLSPTKFATISRSAPKLPPSPGKHATGNSRGCPVSSPLCPPTSCGGPSGKFATRPLPDTPTSFRAALSSDSQDGCHGVSPADRDRLVMGWNLATERSPVYASVQDAIPYSSGSPKYAEIDECGLTSVVPTANKEKDVNIARQQSGATSRVLPSRQFDDDYCSLSSLDQCQLDTVTALKKVAVKNKPSLNRRRSKSMEDIYAVPCRTESFLERRRHYCHKVESSSEENTGPPPMPDKNFSPQSVFQTLLGFKRRKATPQKGVVGTGVIETAPASTVPLKTKENSPQKRRSQEGVEASIKTSPAKKIKADLLPRSEETKDAVPAQSGVDGAAWSTAESSSGGSVETVTPSKLSILTGSLRPTTRSARRAPGNAGQVNVEGGADTSDVRYNSSRQEGGLSRLEVKQLEESPKFPRRKLKRRSSSFSVTPGKGLTFGKSSKISTASPRRVSFAKDVKDTESQSTPRRRSSSRKAVGPPVTRQTKESLNFQAFMSLHASPPNKGKNPPRSSTLGKPMSPVKTSLTNLLGNLKKKPEDHLVTATHSTAFVQNPELRNTGHIRDTLESALSYGEKSPVKREPLPKDGNLFPPSPTRQVGRRVLGSPTKQVSKSTTHGAVQEHNVSKTPDSHIQANQSVKAKQSNAVSSLLSPKKPIHAFMAKLSSKTSVLCADEVRDSHGYSSNDDWIEARSGMGIQHGDFGSERSVAHQHSDSCKSDVTEDTQDLPDAARCKKNSGGLECDTETYSAHRQPGQSATDSDQSGWSPQTFTDEPLLRFDTTFEETEEEFMPHIRLDHDLEQQAHSLQPRAEDVKAFARVAKIWNRTVGFDASVAPFVRKNVQASRVNSDSKATGKERGARYVNSSFRQRWYQKAKTSSADKKTNLDKTWKGIKDGTVEDARLAIGGIQALHVQSTPSVVANIPDSETDGDDGLAVSVGSSYSSIDHTSHASREANCGLVEVVGKSTVVYDVPRNTVCSLEVEDVSFTLPPYPGESPETQPPSDPPSQTTDACTTDTGSSARVDSTPAGDLSFSLPPYPLVPQTELVDNNNIAFPTGEQQSLQATDPNTVSSLPFPDPPINCSLAEASFTLPPYPEIPESGEGLAFTADESAIPAPGLTSPSADQSFTLPPYPDTGERGDVSVPRSNLSASMNKLEMEERHGQPATQDSDELVDCDKSDASSLALPSSCSERLPAITTTTAQQPAVVAQAEISSNLQRFESLRRASPRVEANDSWITARPRSSRNSRGQQSLRAAHSRFLLQSSAGEVEGGDASLNAMPDRDDSAKPFAVSDTANLASTSLGDCVGKEDNIRVAGSSPQEDVNGDRCASVTGTAQAQRSKAINTPEKLSLVRPATLPKTAKVTAFAQRRLNVQNFISSQRSPRPVPKRRSSLTKGQAQHKECPKPGEDFITKNINAVKTVASATVQKQSTTTPSPSLAETKSVTPQTGRRESQNRRRSRTSGSGNGSKPVLTFSTKRSVFNPAEKTSRKRSSGGEKSSENRRRSSKLHGTEGDKQKSFSERRRFFQQLQTNTQPTSVRPLRSDSQRNAQNTAHKALPARIALKGNSAPAVTPKPYRVQAREVQRSRGLVLSPNSDLNV